MGLSLNAYIEELHQRSDLVWPKPLDPVPVKVTPATKPLPGIKAVTWAVYGTLLHIDQGRLFHIHPQEIRMQIALEKTISEFNMWQSMTRKQGQPWEAMLRKYKGFHEDLSMVASKRKGDLTEVDSSKIWRKILHQLAQKEYSYDVGKYGDLDELACKIAYFFHASLQGVHAHQEARNTLEHLTLSGIRQGLLADGQDFTLPQLFHAFRQQGGFSSAANLLSTECVTMSIQQHVRKPSLGLYASALKGFKKMGISPSEVLHVSHRLKDDLAMAKKQGFRTALFVADKNSCQFSAADVRDPEMKPDRLVSSIPQIVEIVGEGG